MHFLLKTLVLFALLYSSAYATPQTTLKLATTTSTENSGLLADILPRFEHETGHKVQVISVGTGKALRLGQDGDVDIVLVHAEHAERAFVEAGYGVERHPIMYNDFVLLGPTTDPAQAATKDNLVDTLRAIHESQSIFISRGDNSGTYVRELALWEKAGITPAGRWYREAGRGMEGVIQMAGELDAYTLADRSTWLAYLDRSPDQSPLTLIFDGDDSLFNPYSIIAVNPKRYPDINYTAAQALINWLISETGQQAIADFNINGHRLFIPNANVISE